MSCSCSNRLPALTRYLQWLGFSPTLSPVTKPKSRENTNVCDERKEGGVEVTWKCCGVGLKSQHWYPYDVSLRSTVVVILLQKLYYLRHHSTWKQYHFSNRPYVTIYYWPGSGRFFQLRSYLNKKVAAPGLDNRD